MKHRKEATHREAISISPRWPRIVSGFVDPAPHLRLQPIPNAGPFGIDDAEAHRIALAAVRHYPLMADNAFLLRADAKDRRPRFFVELVGGELHAHAAHHVESISEQKVFRLGVQACPLHRSRQPAMADFQFSIDEVDFPEPRAADDPVIAPSDDHEWHDGSGFASRERGGDVADDSFRSGDDADL